jgi:hypothetical protein
MLEDLDNVLVKTFGFARKITFFAAKLLINLEFKKISGITTIINIDYIGFEVLTAVVMMSSFNWDVTSRIPLKVRVKVAFNGLHLFISQKK